jgi:Mrp family chromosome partitioning ATPase
MVEVFRNGATGQPSSNGRSSTESPEGVLKVLVAGDPPPDPGEFISTASLGRVLDELVEAFDLVLIDSPPLLSVGDAAALSMKVDAMVVIARLKVVKRSTLQELSRALQTCGTSQLGYVATGAELEEGYGDGGYYYYGQGKREYAASREVEETTV